MHRSVALSAALLCACSLPAPPAVLPPPFGPDPAKPEAARFFFPTGLAIDCNIVPATGNCDPSSQWLVVSNSNADRQYDAGTTYSFRTADFAKYFPPQGAAGTVPFPIESLVGTTMTGNYTGTKAEIYNVTNAGTLTQVGTLTTNENVSMTK